MIFEIMNEIIIEIKPEQMAFFQSQGFPSLKPQSTFNDYFFIVIVGLGFGIYNTYLIDTNIIKKFSLGFIRNNGQIYPKEAIYIFEIIKLLLENLKKSDFKEKFSESLIFWNITNFLMNLLNKFKDFDSLESCYESCLLDSFKILSSFFRNANKENLIILQALEIDAKMSILYKEHMRLLFKKRIKTIGLSKEMKAISTKYYFQKRLNDLFESPEKFKNIMVLNFPPEKKPEKLPDFSLKNSESDDRQNSICLFILSYIY